MLKKVATVKVAVNQIPVDVCYISCFLGDCAVTCSINA